MSREDRNLSQKMPDIASLEGQVSSEESSKNESVYLEYMNHLEKIATTDLTTHTMLQLLRKLPESDRREILQYNIELEKLTSNIQDSLETIIDAAPQEDESHEEDMGDDL
jgi:Na+/phosphate symporter